MNNPIQIVNVKLHAARLERKSFFCVGKSPGKKRLGALRQAQDKLQTDKAAIIILVVGYWLMVISFNCFEYLTGRLYEARVIYLLVCY